MENFQWIKATTMTPIVTLYPNNLTLNNAAATYFEEYKYVMIGTNYEMTQIAIKPIPKKDIDLKLVPIENLHKVSIGKGYARISNKPLLDSISKKLGETPQGKKFQANYDEKQSILLIDLTKEG